MHQWNHFTGITVVNGRVYLGTYDGTLVLLRPPALSGGLTPIDGPPRNANRQDGR